MADVTELRLAFTVKDFDQALAFYRDALGMEQLADWSSEAGRVVALDAAGRCSNCSTRPRQAWWTRSRRGAGCQAPSGSPCGWRTARPRPGGWPKPGPHRSPLRS